MRDEQAVSMPNTEESPVGAQERRPMRRADHRMTDEDALALIARADVVRLGFSDDEGPYVVPVNFGYEDGRLYIHGPLEGRRIDAARRGARVCFEIDEGSVVRAELPCGFTSSFESVVGYGTMRLLEGREACLHGLDVIMRHHGTTIDGFREKSFLRTSVVEITIESMEGKRHRPKPAVKGE